LQVDKNVNSTIGANSFFEGKYAVKGSLKIDGKFEGESLYVDQLMVGPGGKVKTDINATSVVVEGIVVGNIAATSRILLLATARVLGDIKTPELIIQDGVVLEGKCTISHYQINDTKKYIVQSYNRETE